MSDPLYAFVHGPEHPNGLGIFQGDDLALELSKRMSKAQIKKYDKHERVPTAFYLYMRFSEITRRDERSPRFGSTIGELLDYLRWYPYRTEGARSTGMFLYEEILKSRNPELKRSFASRSDVWAMRQSEAQAAALLERR